VRIYFVFGRENIGEFNDDPKRFSGKIFKQKKRVERNVMSLLAL
jgi:hypothetical protein